MDLKLLVNGLQFYAIYSSSTAMVTVVLSSLQGTARLTGSRPGIRALDGDILSRDSNR